MSPQPSKPDPKRGEIWAHTDGGSWYIIHRTGRMVRAQRRPFGDAMADPVWMRIDTFAKFTTGRL